MKKIELLAPAGGPEQFRAAVNAGADAVYIGGSIFNARAGAGNFTLDEINEAVDYGHVRNVRTFITLNTLMNDSDIPKALKFASDLYELGADALIIQDLGLGYAIRNIIPDFELHLSTQATVYNPEGVRAAQDLGYRRTVLSRELTIDEIRACASIGEVEVFVHGAMCICYSGQCQMSRYIGGRSGNKGMCAQPCRLPYIYRNTEGQIISTGSVLSPKDMCQINNLGELIEAGVSSLKIEGRMKSSEYVASVVSVYRKYIDEYYNKGSYKVSASDMSDLLQSFNRDGFTEAYLHRDPESELMTSGIAKNTGLLSGTVVKNSARPRHKTSKTNPTQSNNSPSNFSLIEIRPESEVSMHDILEIRSETGSASFKVTYIKPLAGGNILLGDINEPVSKGDKVYKLISQDLNDRMHRIISSDKRIPVDIYINIIPDTPIKVTAKEPVSRISFTYTDPEIIPQPAINSALSEDDIRKQFSKTGDSAFLLGRMMLDMSHPVFVRISSLNSLRRNALKGLEEKIIASYKRRLDRGLSDANISCESAPHDLCAELSGSADQQESNITLLGSEENKILSTDLSKNAESDELPSGPLISEISHESLSTLSNDTVILPFVTKGPYDQWLRNNLNELASSARRTCFSIVVNNPAWVKPVSALGIRVIGGPGLNITNMYSVKALMELGMSEEYVLSPELIDKNKMDGIPLMITEHRLTPGTLTDRKGAEYAVEYNEELHKSFIFSK